MKETESEPKLATKCGLMLNIYSGTPKYTLSPEIMAAIIAFQESLSRSPFLPFPKAKSPPPFSERRQ